ncbi:MAG TPA: MFS transporter [Chloroflexota bacterium]|nr:MFS transporter [Chloroflexota bacterium]
MVLDRGPVDAIWGNRPFMFLWSAQAISQTAQNAIWFALMVLIEETTHSTTQIGIAMIAFILPSVIFTVPAGVMVDRIDKRLVLVSTNWLRAVAVLGYIFFNQSLSLVYTVTFVFSVVSQFFMPAEAAMIPAVVGRRKLITANSLFNLTYTLSQLMGMVVMAPIVIKFFGVNTLFFAIAVLFAICGFLVLPLPSGLGVRTEVNGQDGGRALERFFRDLRDTWDFVVSDKAATMAMVILTCGSTLSLVTAMLAPRFMVAVVGIRADDTVYVLAPAGVGMAIGAVAIGRLTRWVSKELLIVVGMFGVAVGMLLLAIVTPLWDFLFAMLAILVDPSKLPHIVSLVTMVMVIAGFMGLALSMVIISSQTILQEQTPSESRGRIFAVQIMMGNLASILPLVFIGELADLLGVSRVLVVLAVLMFSLGSMSMRAYRIRPGDEPGGERRLTRTAIML